MTTDFKRHDVSRGDNWYMYRDSPTRIYIYRNINAPLYYEHDKLYPQYDTHYKYIYDLLENDKNDGPLTNPKLCYYYLLYLTTAQCIHTNISQSLLSFIFDRLGITPGSIHWKHFEDILEKMNKYDYRIGQTWDSYDFQRKNKPGPDKATADYFIYYESGKPIEEYDLDTILNLNDTYYMKRLPARRPMNFEYSIKRLPNNMLLYRNTYIYHSNGNNTLKKKRHLTKDELIVSRLYKGDYNLSNEEVELLKSMLTSDTIYDVDTCDREITNIISKNVFTITIDALGIDLASNGFINIENFMKTRKDLLKIWLNWNYYEDDEMTDSMYMKFLYRA